MELHELQVGDLRSGAQGERDPVGGGHRRVGGGAVELAEAPGGQQDGGGADHAGHAVGVEHRQAGDTARPAPQHLDRGVAGEEGRTAAGGGQQGAFDLGPGGVPAGVDDPERGVAPLPRAVEPPVGAPVEDSSQVPQVGDGGGAGADDRVHGAGIAEPHPGGEGVGDVPFGGVVVGAVGEDDRHAALGPGGAALGRFALADDQHSEPEAGGAQRRGQSGHAGSDDHEVRAGLPARCALVAGVHSPPPGCPMAIILRTASRPRSAVSWSTVTSSRPSRRQRSNAAGVIIFM